MYNSDLQLVSIIPDVVDAWEYFKSIFLEICDKHAPLRRFRVSGRNNPWFNESVSNLIKQRNVAWSKAKKTNSDEDWSQYRLLRNKCTKSIKSSKSQYYLNLINNNMNDPSKFWKLTKSLVGSKKSTDLPKALKLNQRIITDKLNIVDMFNSHFISASSITDFSNSLVIEEQGIDESTNYSESDLFSFTPILPTQVHKLLSNLDCKKSGGSDKIEPIYFKVSADIIAEPIASIFNLSLSTNIIPPSWKSAMVMPLLKGGNPSDLNNYRPVSKPVFESMVNDQMKEYLLRRNILNAFQSGFRAGHSTITATTVVTNDLITALDRRQHCAALFVDLTKAFDLVDHALLLQRLKSIGLGNSALSWFKNYLSDRTQCVAVDNYTSSIVRVRKGVPQGSLLAPLLFSIFINELGQVIKSAKLHFYADDTIIYSTASSLSQAIETLQDSFYTFQRNLLKLKLDLNENKTKYIIFTRSRSMITAPPILTIDDLHIERVSTYKYLGIWLDEKLAFDVHIDYLVKRLKPRLGFLFWQKKCFSFGARKRIIQSTFLPILDYGDVIYMHASTYLLNRLDGVYDAALRFITNACSRTHHCLLYNYVGWSSLCQRRKSHMLLYIVKTLLGMLPNYITSLLCLCGKNYSTRSSNGIKLVVPRVHSEHGKSSFSYYAPWLWNEFQATTPLETIPPLNIFKNVLQCKMNESCCCFN